MSRDPKQKGATVKGAAGTGAEGNDGGSVETGSVGGECRAPAKGGEKKVLNEKVMEEVMAPENLNAAYLAVKANKGAAGIDGISTEELGDHVRKHWPGIKAKLEEGTYRPSAVRAVEIAKSGGGKRQLGIPTTVDRLIQQALHQVL